ALAHPLPGDARQQRHVFDRAVRAGVQPDAPPAYLLVDALRYEMAAELMDSLAGTPQIRSTLRPWASELPSETAVGMNALAPVARGGRLFPHVRDGAIKGFKAGEFTVSTPKDRVRAMREALQLPALPHLDLRLVAESTPTDLMTRCGTAPLLVVMGDEIDKALENRLGPEHFDTALRRLRTAVLRLREAGFKRVVITADHGFLLRRGLDEGEEGAAGKISFGAKATPQRRHVWWPHPQHVPGTLSVAAGALRYEDMPAEAQHLLLASGLAVFDRGDKQDDCVHGGETPQERVIPVLVLDFQGQAVRGDDARFAVHIERRDPVAGMQCLTLRVTPAEAQGALSFALPEALDLLLHAELDGARLEVVDVRGGERHGDLVRVALDTPCEVFAKLTADYDGRSRVLAHRPERPGSLVGARSDAFFAVVGRVRVKDQTQAPDPGA
ncbi:MAG: PglZ domain-containing protein, partial [Myxococcales bacterium]|nr:PglZ domain-containing protein [Myxococcales bacterium]